MVAGSFEPSSFREGERVRVQGLKARADLNGSLGTIVEWDEAEERWKVHMDDGSGKMLRSCHLERCRPEPTTVFTPNLPGQEENKEDPPAKLPFAPKACVRIKGLQARPEMNGLKGVLIEWDALEERWQVQLYGPEAAAQELQGVHKNVREDNLELIEGGDASESQSSAEPFAKAKGELALGCRVVVRQLQKRPELNGRSGEIVGWDPQEERWQVALDDGAGLLLKTSNLELCDTDAVKSGLAAGARVQVKGLQVRPELNGLRGKVVEWDEAEGRWKVLMDDGSGKMLKSVNLEVSGADEAAATPQLKPGGRVRVAGLQARPELNGLCGTLLEWDTQEERWKVRLDEGSGKMLREANLEPLPDSELARMSAPRILLSAGSRVRVHSLQTQPLLNGCLGTVVEWDAQQERWKVHMEDGSDKLFRPANIEPLGDVGQAPPSPPRAAQMPFAPAPAPAAPPAPAPAAPAPAAPAPAAPAPAAPAPEAPVAPAPAAPAPAAPAAPASPAPATSVSAASAEAAFQEPVPGFTPFAPGRLEKGCRVKVVDLKARPDLNGRLGEIVDWDDTEQRWKVLLDDGVGKLLKPANLVQCLTFEPGARVRVKGLKARPEINGCAGSVVDWDEDECRWKVHMDDGSGKLLKPENLEPESLRPDSPASSQAARSAQAAEEERPTLAPKMRVQVHGLRMQRELNGQMGTLEAWDEDQERWQVVMDDGSGKLLRPDNLQPTDAAPPAAAKAAASQPAERLSGLYPGCRVKLQDLQQQRHINGCCGTVLGWDRMEQRWQVRLDEGEGRLLRPENLEPLPSVAPGARARLRGLRSAQELNGLLGVVRRWDATEERWQVLMDGGLSKMIRPVNLELLDGTERIDECSQTPAESSEKLLEKPPERPLDKLPERPLEKPPERLLEKTPQRPLERPLETPRERKEVSEKAAERPTERPTFALLPGCRVQVSELRRAELNGAEGALLEWVEQIERWKVVLDDGSSLLLRSCNLRALNHGWNSATAQTCE